MSVSSSDTTLMYIGRVDVTWSWLKFVKSMTCLASWRMVGITLASKMESISDLSEFITGLAWRASLF